MFGIRVKTGAGEKSSWNYLKRKKGSKEMKERKGEKIGKKEGKRKKGRRERGPSKKEYGTVARTGFIWRPQRYIISVRFPCKP